MSYLSWLTTHSTPSISAIQLVVLRRQAADHIQTVNTDYLLMDL